MKEEEELEGDAEEEENKDEAAADEKADDKSGKQKKDPVIDVTEDNINSYTIEDVVMPMIGHDIRMPKNEELGQIYTEILLKDGVSASDFAALSKQDSLSASGAYRKIVARPEDVVFDIT